MKKIESPEIDPHTWIFDKGIKNTMEQRVSSINVEQQHI